MGFLIFGEFDIYKKYKNHVDDFSSFFFATFWSSFFKQEYMFVIHKYQGMSFFILGGFQDWIRVE
jgi:hypothetical protein